MKTLLLLLLLPFFSQAQKIESFWNAQYKPTVNKPRYYVVTTSKDSVYHREVIYVPEKVQAMTGTYLDSLGKIPHGTITWFHLNRGVRSISEYRNGKKHGLTLRFNDKGALLDSGNFINGHLQGQRLQWNGDGIMIDSMNFDGNGSGVQVSWRDDGSLSSSGRWINDTTKVGKWKHFHANGKPMAEIVYENGKESSRTCFDETGAPLADEACKDIEASLPQNFKVRYTRMLTQALDQIIKKDKTFSGYYEVYVQFYVDKDGTLKGFTPLTSFGHGLEEKAIEVLKATSPWIPARQYGVPVKSYFSQPVTFVIEE